LPLDLIATHDAQLPQIELQPMRAAPPMLSLWPYKRKLDFKKKLKTCWFGFARWFWRI